MVLSFPISACLAPRYRVLCPLKINVGLVGCSETSLVKYPSTLHDIYQDRRPEDGAIYSRTLCESTIAMSRLVAAGTFTPLVSSSDRPL